MIVGPNFSTSILINYGLFINNQFCYNLSYEGIVNSINH